MLSGLGEEVLVLVVNGRLGWHSGGFVDDDEAGVVHQDSVLVCGVRDMKRDDDDDDVVWCGVCCGVCCVR